MTTISVRVAAEHGGVVKDVAIEHWNLRKPKVAKVMETDWPMAHMHISLRLNATGN